MTTESTNRTVVSRLQLGWLKAMGVDVPWIVAPKAHSAGAQPSEPSAPQALVSPAVSPAATPSSPPITRPITPAITAPITPPTQTPAPPTVELAGVDLAGLSEQVHACQACGLCAGRQRAVPGDGARQPSILVVGEAPGEQEDREGLPFVGRSGELLDNMLQAIGHDRHTTVYMTNVVKCRPPANRNPRDEEMAACAPYLARQIELLEPKVILAMGRFAAHALLKTEAPLQQLRQTVHEVQSAGRPLPVVVTYHPAYLLRRPVDKRLAWEDLKRLRALTKAQQR